MKNQIDNVVTVDEYCAKMGKDKDIVTITFKIISELAASDLVTWFERGYNFVLDASISDGEVEPNTFLVFVEMDRRLKVPWRICTLLSDLEPLTDISLDEWIVEIDGVNYPADPNVLKHHIILNPNLYKQSKDEELDKMRELSGVPTTIKPVKADSSIRALKSLSGIN